MFRVREESTLAGLPVVSERDSSSFRGTEPHNLTFTLTVPKADEGVDAFIMFERFSLMILIK